MISMIAWIIVLGCWIFLAAILWKKIQSREKVTIIATDPQAKLGFYLEAIGFILVFIPRELFSALIYSSWLTILLPVIGVYLAIWSVRFIYNALTHLDKHFAVNARIIAGHKLVTTGPYQIVRHPMYTGMFGMLAATGLVNARWYLFLPAVAFYWIGTNIRIKIEERLLFESFDRQFADYAAQVPALIPRRLFSR